MGWFVGGRFAVQGTRHHEIFGVSCRSLPIRSLEVGILETFGTDRPPQPPPSRLSSIGSPWFMGGSTHLDDLTSSLSMGRTSPPNVKITSKNTILQSPKIAGQTNHPLNVDHLPIRIQYFPLLEIIEGYCTLSPHWKKTPAETAKSPLASALLQSLPSLAVGIFSTRIPLIDILNVSKSSRIRSPRNNPEAKNWRFSDHQNWILWHQQSWRWANVQFFFAFRTHQRWVYDMF